MNQVTLIGRLVRDPEVRYTTDGKAIARFALAIDRGKGKDGNDLGADFPNVVAFGKVAELIERFFKKGKPVCIMGRIQTGSYEKDGHKVYTTDVIADRIEFLPREKSEDAPESQETVPGFAMLTDEDIPF